MSRQTTQQRLLARLREMRLPLPEGTRLVRTHAGHIQRAQGSWSWFAIGPDGRALNIGSQAPMGEILRAAKLSIDRSFTGDIHVDID